MPSLRCRVERPVALPHELVTSMYELFSRYYEMTSLDRFVSDLREKDSTLLFFDQEETLGGFTNLKILDVIYRGSRRRAIFSGDTIIDHRYWGQQVLVHEWCREAGRIKAEFPTVPLYWFLICKGHRTYRFLNCFSHAFYPNYRTVTPAEEKRFMDELATQRFGSAYDVRRGLVEFASSLGQLKECWQKPTKAIINRDARYFVSLNPDYQRGVELMCLTELSPQNLRGAAQEAFLEGFNANHESLEQSSLNSQAA